MSKIKSVSTAVLSVLGLVFAISVLIFSAIPCIGYYALIPSLITLVFGIIGLVYLKKEGKSIVIALLAILLSLLAIASSVYQYIEFKAVYETKERIENSLNHFEKKVQNEAEDAVIDYTKEKIHDWTEGDTEEKKGKNNRKAFSETKNKDKEVENEKK